MPLVTVHYASHRPDAARLKPAVARVVARAAADVLGKREDLTAVIVTAVPPADWFVAGRDLAASGLASYAVEIRITDGTNAKADKAAYIARLHADMADVLGPVHTESYVHVFEARADAYGYGGLTQEFRFVAARMDEQTRTAAAASAIAHHGDR